jgi:hypothetical protein
MNSIELPLTNCFIGLMLFILWAWDLPERNLLNRLVLTLKWPIRRLGLGHGWQMFSPDPVIDNCRLQFKLRLADGSIVAIEPEYLRYPLAQRQHAHYRWAEIKIALVQAGSDSLRASMCKYIAAGFLAQFAAEEQRLNKCPVEVQLVRWRQRIAPLEAKETASRDLYKQRVIYTQPISPAPLVATAVREGEPVRLNLCAEQS